MNGEFDNELETVVVKKENLQYSAKPRKKVKTGMFGIPEFLALGLGILSLLGVAIFYFFIASPSYAEVNKHKADRDRLEKESKDADSKFGNITTTEAKVSELVNSVDLFERSYLPFANVGKAGLYQRVNNLITAYGLTNISGPDYTPLEISDKPQNSVADENQGGRDKLKSLFPGVYISMTLEGDYQNLRRFIREMESGNQFIVVNSIELEGAEAKEKREQKQQLQGLVTQPTPIPNSQPIYDDNNKLIQNPQPKIQAKSKSVTTKGKTRGETVNLRIEMAAYFRRNNIPNVVNLEAAQ
jgi:hypothetical protein